MSQISKFKYTRRTNFRTLCARLLSAALLIFVGMSNATAEIVVEVVEGYDKQTKIAVVPFGGSAQVREQEDIASIIGFDLARSGQFAPLEVDNMLSFPSRANEVSFRDWRVLGMEYLLIGNGRVESDGQITLR